MLNVKTNVSSETPVVADDGLFKVEITYIGEGYNGDYDSSNPEDEPLLRFYTYRNSNHNTEKAPSWEEVSNGSYCTSVSKNSDIVHVVETAKKILQEFRKCEEEGYSIKKTAEKMSYLS